MPFVRGTAMRCKEVCTQGQIQRHKSGAARRVLAVVAQCDASALHQARLEWVCHGSKLIGPKRTI